jgi:hypothetical protein
MKERIDSLIFCISMAGFAITLGGFFCITARPYIAIIGIVIALSYPTYYFIIRKWIG